MMRVLSVASECSPVVKTGGLADVVGALPAALAAEGVEMRVLLPGYPQVLRAVDRTGPVMEEWDLFGGPARVVSAQAAGLDLLVVEAPHLYDRPGSIYLGPDGHDWPDNPERFAGLCWMAARIGREGLGGWQPDVLHCHDWQGALVPEYCPRTPGERPGIVLTIHNMAFHGLAPPSRVGSLRLDPWRFHAEGYEYWGQISALKAGLLGADRLTTVSPTYAAELMRPEGGMGLDGVMRRRREVVSGILNGIDEDAWNPATDPAVAAPYDSPEGKAPNKAALRAEMGLADAPGPLCVVVSRLTSQKGLDMLLGVLPALLERGGQLALLGSGEAWMEQAFRDAAGPSVAVRIGYDEALSHRLLAGGDAILVPSRFEPCGLTQLYGLRYGTIPVVGFTGGLVDTVINASPAALAVGVATGLQFHPVTADALHGALSRLCDLWHDRDVWLRMQRNAMAQPVGWAPSAKAYARLYRDIAPVR
ncbi:glycogen synthase GlgA [Rubellimicrobium sp. CFH 75288]|uniref:glycogen synthase GlgA n=1 Tax=Rubellimicrobium sp. CFH 75288 TaxID=2697034 RepID=UPI001411D269|nr:glycogen synthase GlgA [Rubellimicrobium sp. CFH 75288]NAZ36060.1 glycogen synthase GlgA [Rubellimicrobium sp. CFH 75288]